MGQQQSTPVQPESRINSLSRSVFSEIEKYTLRNKNITSDVQIFEEIGFSVGSELAVSSAQFLASYPYSMSKMEPIHENILKVIGFYNLRLIEALKLDSKDFIKLLFLSLAVRQTNQEREPLQVDASTFYIQYMDMLNFVSLLCSVYDQDPARHPHPTVGTTETDAAKLILEPFKGPIINLDQFKTLVERFPYLLHSLEILWSKLLFDKPSSDSAADSTETPSQATNNQIQSLKISETAIKPHEICILYMVRGPEITKAIKLYQAKNDGFSMRAFEGKVVNWKSPTLFFVKGKRFTKPTPDLDAVVPKVTDSVQRTSTRVSFAIIVDHPWKVSNKNGFAGKRTIVYQLEPHFSIFTVAPAAADNGIGYFSPDIGGIGFGLPPPQAKCIAFQRNGNVALVLDRFLENGVFRCIGPGGTFNPDNTATTPVPYEDRFAITTIETWGIGDEKVLARQKREWDWERREAIRRQNVNVGEDRSILELAGIVGQFDPNRGTN